MTLEILELLSDAEGIPALKRTEVPFRSADNAMTGNEGKLSTPQAVKSMVFVDLPKGFESSSRIPDRAQTAVVIRGTILVAAGEEEGETIKPGVVLRLPVARSSTHTFKVVGHENAILMLLFA